MAARPADALRFEEAGGSDVEEELGGEVGGEEFGQGGAEAEAGVEALGELFHGGGGKGFEGVLVEVGGHEAEEFSVEGQFAGLLAGWLEGIEAVGAVEGDVDGAAFEGWADAWGRVEEVLGADAEGLGLADFGGDGGGELPGSGLDVGGRGVGESGGGAEGEGGEQEEEGPGEGGEGVHGGGARDEEKQGGGRSGLSGWARRRGEGCEEM